jgi:hypothetical protein
MTQKRGTSPIPSIAVVEEGGMASWRHTLRQTQVLRTAVEEAKKTNLAFRTEKATVEAEELGELLDQSSDV